MQTGETEPERQAEFPQIENVEIQALLGKGAMASVYKGKQVLLDRTVAVKVLSREAVQGEGRLARFQLEAKLTANLDHPNIIRTLGSGITANGEAYLLLEYVEGKTLAEEIATNAPLSFGKIKSIFLPVLSALQYAHQQGIVHRDVKPGNIMICNEGGSSTVKLLDFGIARLLERDPEQVQLTQAGVSVGSPAYMSPEQCIGKELDGRSDLYSLSCVLYESLAGRPPFSADSALSVMQMHFNEQLPPAPELAAKIGVSESLARLLLSGLAKSASDRPASAEEFSNKLSTVLNDVTLDRAPRAKEKNIPGAGKLPVMISSVCIVLMVAVAVVFFFQKPSLHGGGSPGGTDSPQTENRIRQLDKAKQFLSEASEAKKQGDDKQAEFLCWRALSELAQRYDRNTNLQETAAAETAILTEAARIFKGLNRKTSGQLELFNNICNQHRIYGDQDEIDFLQGFFLIHGYYGDLPNANDALIKVAGLCAKTQRPDILKSLLVDTESFLDADAEHRQLQAPTQVFLDLSYAYYHRTIGDKEAALRHREKAEEDLMKYKDNLSTKQEFRGYFELARFDEAIDDLESAYKHLERCKKPMLILIPKYPESGHQVIFEIADVLKKLGRLDDALSELKYLKKLLPYDTETVIEADKRIVEYTGLKEEKRFKQERKRKRKEGAKL